jgi:hypothetical protein
MRQTTTCISALPEVQSAKNLPCYTEIDSLSAIFLRNLTVTQTSIIKPGGKMYINTCTNLVLNY